MVEARRLTSAGAQLALADPVRTLRRGFAIVRDGSGAVVTRAAGVEPRQILELSLADGTVTTRVFDSNDPRPHEESGG
jgi:exodeoxyribonuclease VII large subunit